MQDEEPHQIMNVMDVEVSECWIIDSSCSFHISSHKEWFRNFQPSNGSVLLGNNHVCSIKGEGSIRLRLKNESVILLSHVYTRGQKKFDLTWGSWIKKGLIRAVEDEDLIKCEQCIVGKGKKLPFPKGKHTSKSVLDYAQSDIWGPSQPPTINGGRYFMTLIINDYSRKLWVQILMERKKGTKLKCLRTDNGQEIYLLSSLIIVRSRA